jgi:hypothetical protein
VTDASAKGQAADPGVADDPAGGGQPQGLALLIKMGVETSALQLDGSSQGIDP